MIDQIVGQTYGSVQNVHNEEFGKRLIVMDGANDCGFFQTGDDTFGDGFDGSHAQRLPDQAAFAAEVTRFNNGKHRLSAVGGNYFDLGLAFLEIEDPVGRIAL